MPTMRERWAGRNASEIAAFEMGYAFIHNSEVAKEMAGRIHRVAERAAKAEVELSSLRSQVETLIQKWRDAAVWEHDDMHNTQSAQTFDQCADELSAALGKNSR